MLLKQPMNPLLIYREELIQQFYGSAAILITVMNAQTLYVSHGLGIVHGLRYRAPTLSSSHWERAESVLSSHFSRYRHPVRMLALDISSAANQDTIL
jgi:hypothetical protein